MTDYVTPLAAEARQSGDAPVAYEMLNFTGVEDTSVRKDIVCKNIHFLHELSDMQRRHTDPRPSQALSLRSQPRRMGPVVSNLTLVGFAVLYEQVSLTLLG